MSVIGSNALAGASGQAAAGYANERSLRFNSADSAYLNRTPSSAGNRKTWTWAGWVKRGKLGIDSIFGLSSASISPGLGTEYIRFRSSDTIDWFVFHNGSSWTGYLATSQVFRDPSAWMHIVCVVDLQNATSTDRLRLYVNGSRVITFSTAAYPNTTDSTAINAAQLHQIGRQSSGDYFDGYLADVHFIDGQALAPTDFGEFDANGVWQPIEYTGTYGTNGFKLNFSNNSSAAALGTDSSGNSNTWTVNNISVAAGAGNDSLFDFPTNGTQTDTGAGGEVSGNYCTWNPLNNGATSLANGNLDVTTPGIGYGLTYGTIGVSSGRWYWEITPTATAGAAEIGIAKAGATLTSAVGVYASGYSYVSSALKGNNNSYASYGVSYTTNDVIGVALDLDAGTLVFYKNNSSQGVAFSSLSGEFFPVVSDSNNGNVSTLVANFGQRAFAYAAPSGFKALNTANLPDPTIADGSTAMDAVTYTGTNSAQSITSLAFQPDFIWFKARSYAGSHALVDSVRGISKQLQSNTTNAESTNSAGAGPQSFDSNGFTLGTESSAIGSTNGTQTYVAWTWDAGTSDTSVTAGSLNSSVYDQSQTWSTGASTDGSNFNSTTSADAFDDTISTFWQTTDNATQTYAFTSLSSGTLEVYLHGNPSTYSIEVNGSAISSPTATTAAWVTFAANASTITSVDLVRTGTKVAVGGWRLNGKLLVDSGVTPTNVPSIASTVRANPSAGFSIVSYTGSSTGTTVAHGLNAAPNMIIVKDRDFAYNWQVNHISIGADESLILNRTDNKADYNAWNDTRPTSLVFSLGAGTLGVNSNGNNLIAYCFAPVEGYSAFGSYTGNGSADGPFVYTGFRPAWLLIKVTDYAGESWVMKDSSRGTYNPNDPNLYADQTIGEQTGSTSRYTDFLSNGFKLRGNELSVNGSGYTYLYACFSENPFKYARAR